MIGCGERIWTSDLQVMSLTSYQTAPPRVKNHRNLKSNTISIFLRFGSDLLSHVLRRSTIGATVLNGRVRNGIECFTRAIATKP